jgi:hypothetical protein
MFVYLKEQEFLFLILVMKEEKDLWELEKFKINLIIFIFLF